MAGFTPVTYTRYEKDANGDVVASWSVTESVWSPDDVALLIVSRQAENERDENGFLWSEATDPANADAFYGPEVPTVNFATKSRLDRADAHYKKWDKPNAPVNRNGHIWRVLKRPTE